MYEESNKTLIIIKPDAMERNLSGKIITFFTDNNLFLIQAKTMLMTQDIAKEFYRDHKEKLFFNELVEYISSGTIMTLILNGPQCINKAREIIGHTDLALARPGTIRSAFAISLTKNSVHGSDSEQSAQREINLLFNN